MHQSLERAAAQGNHKASHEALLQLGLCKIVGFGVPQNISAGLEQVKKAAALSLSKAKGIVFRLYAAVGVSIPGSEKHEMLSWLKTAAAAGSTIALSDLRNLDYEAFQQLMLSLLEGSDAEVTINQRFRNAVTFGRLESIRKILTQGADLSWKDENNASCLYWVSTCFEETASQAAALLLDSGAQVNVKTGGVDRIANATDDGHYLNVVPAHTTPLEWAIMQDNLAVMKVLLEASIQDDVTYLKDNMESTPLGCASRYQSQQCLAWLCTNNSSEILRVYDGYGFSALYYAIRPDILDRMLRYPVHTQQPQSYIARLFPVVERELTVITTLLDSGSELTIHKDKAFSCLHLAAALTHPKVLSLLLAVPQSTELLGSLSEEQYPPLQEAIFRSDIEIFMTLWEKLDENSIDLSCGPRYHAIHLCCVSFHDTSRVFADLLFAKDPSCLRQQSYPNGALPLHIAAERGNAAMIDFCISHGTSLLSIAWGLTPLGWAIRSRSLVGVDVLCRYHQMKKLPKLATVTKLGTEYLLTPGYFSPSDSKPQGAGFYYFDYYYQDLDEHSDGIYYECCNGCYDEPFSDLSQKVLKSLLGTRESVSYYDFRKLLFWHPIPRYTTLCLRDPWQTLTRLLDFILNLATLAHPTSFKWAALRPAVDRCCLVALKTIATTQHYAVDDAILRVLIHRAFSASLYHESRADRGQASRNVLEYLQQLQRERFESTRIRRLEQPISSLGWMLYYRACGDREQRCFDQFYQWLSKARTEARTRQHTDLATIFIPFSESKFSFRILMIAVLWSILVPLFKYQSAFRHSIAIPSWTRTPWVPFGLACVVRRTSRPKHQMMLSYFRAMLWYFGPLLSG